MSQTTLITTKGRFTGTVAECAAWLAEMQPSSVRAERAGVEAEIEVPGTPGAQVYERAIEAALAAESESGWTCARCGAGAPALTDRDRAEAEYSHRDHCESAPRRRAQS